MASERATDATSVLAPPQHMRERSQFDALLRRAPQRKSTHFALHGGTPDATLSELFPGPGHWVGVVLPKRWARRAVTRNLLRRQIYAAAHALAPSQPPLALVVHLRSAIAPGQFPSAASLALRRCIRAELQQLLQGLHRA